MVAGDQVQAIDGRPIERWAEIETALRASGGRPLTLSVLRDGRATEVRLEPRTQKTRDIFGQEIEVWDLGLHPLVSTRIGQVLPGQVAQQAGVRGGDRVVAVNGTPVAEWDQLAKVIHGSPGKSLTLTIEREGQRQDIPVVPRATKQQGPAGQEEIGLIGIGPAPESQLRRLNPISAVWAGAAKTVDLAVLVVTGFVKLIQAKISPSTIGGPILIAQMAGEVAQRGILELLSFTALLSINLAILNLLPIPILDGGHLLFSFIEWVRGRPVSLRKREIAQQVGMVLLVALMVFAFYNDIFRWLGQ
jgi:regulator of sigma E protease